MFPQMTPEQFQEWLDDLDMLSIIQQEIAEGIRNPDGAHKWELILAEIGATEAASTETDRP